MEKQITLQSLLLMPPEMLEAWDKKHQKKQSTKQTFLDMVRRLRIEKIAQAIWGSLLLMMGILITGFFSGSIYPPQYFVTFVLFWLILWFIGFLAITFFCHYRDDYGSFRSLEAAFKDSGGLNLENYLDRTYDDIRNLTSVRLVFAADTI